MRHHDSKRKFGRKKGQRRAFLKSLARNLIHHERMITSEARAKEIRSHVERFITYGKKQNLAGLRALLRFLPKETAYKVYHDLAVRYRNRAGGYTRVIKQARARKHDGARMAIIEFV